MTDLPALAAGGHGALVTFLAILQGVLELLRPSLDMIIPGMIALVVHRYIGNRIVADAVTSGAGVAYNHLSAQYARDGRLDFASAKAAAVSAGVMAISDIAQKQLATLTAAQLAAKVDGALGTLLASDPGFSATGVPPSSAVVRIARDPTEVNNVVSIPVEAAPSVASENALERSSASSGPSLRGSSGIDTGPPPRQSPQPAAANQVVPAASA